MNNQKTKNKSDFAARLSKGLDVFFGFLIDLLARSLTNRKTWSWKSLKFWGSYWLITALIVYAPSWDIPGILNHMTWVLPADVGTWIGLHIARWGQLTILYIIPMLLWLLIFGSYLILKTRRFQTAIDHLGFKTSTNLKPVVVDAITTGESQKKVIVRAIGIDVAELKNRKGALESSFNAIIEDIRASESNRQLFEILMAEKALPQVVYYDKVAMRFLIKPYTFLVGESLSSFIVGDLLELHHMIVAGATGGGKSYFFKQVLVGLAESSRYIQFYLIDLKRGVETKTFGKLENVRIAKEAPEAVMTLAAVVEEMEARFRFLEERGLTEIDPERDKKDRIVVAIDEASVLFTVERSSKSTKDSAQKARDLTDRIAKLGRAAAIHLILATQKVVKETIDTRVQTNISARMVFRVNTVASSMTVLGNKLAADLPEIKGRGIWSFGSKDITVQVPKLDPGELKERIDLLTEKFNGSAKSHFGPMLEHARENVITKTSFPEVALIEDKTVKRKGAA